MWYGKQGQGQALQDTDLERACAATIRKKLLKIGAVIVRNTRRIRLPMTSHHPPKRVFFAAAQALAPSLSPVLFPPR